MLKLAKPKLILSDFNIVRNVKAALQELQMDIPILTFDGESEGTQNIEILFEETNLASFEYGYLPSCIWGWSLL